MKTLLKYTLQWTAVMYLFAFSSLYVQIPGLYGDRGVLPAGVVLKSDPHDLDSFLQQPSFIRMHNRYGLSVEEMMDACCLLGILLSSMAFLFSYFRTTACYLALFLLYLAVYEVGQTFLWFQWDILLLELGFISIFAADIGLLGPYLILPKFSHSSISLLLFRWLFFRLLFSSGIVKLMSKCPTWWGLTALNYHYESQCIPTPLSWYAHQLPDWLQKFSVASTFIIQIAMMAFVFSPFTMLVKIVLYGNVLLQILILLTGNYNFFNVTTIVLCISLMDGGKVYHSFLRNILPSILQGKLVRTSVNWVGVLAGVAAMSWFTAKYFSLYMSHYWPPEIHSKIAFTETDLNNFVKEATPLSIFTCLCLLAMAIMTSMIRAFQGEKSIPVRLYQFWATCLYSFLALLLFTTSCVPYCRAFHQPVPKFVVDIGAVSNYQRITREFSLPVFNSYGLFRRMTGVGGRPEVIVEASMSRNGPWKPYEFLYKPGIILIVDFRAIVFLAFRYVSLILVSDIFSTVDMSAPHQPRLDWQMWFAALSSVEYSPWFVSLVDRFFSAEPEVLALIYKAPFGKQQPNFIRAKLYHYHYTSHFSGKHWWRRDSESEFLPAVTKDDLVRYVAKMRIPLKPHTPTFPVAEIRRAIGNTEGFRFIAVIFVSLMITKLLISKTMG